MIQNINFVHYHNLGIEITDSPNTQNSSSHTRKSPGTQKPHHRIKRAFHITLPWLLTTLTSQILPPGLGHFQVILILRVLPISLDPNPTLPHDSEHKMCASPQPYRHWDYRFNPRHKIQAATTQNHQAAQKQPPHQKSIPDNPTMVSPHWTAEFSPRSQQRSYLICLQTPKGKILHQHKIQMQVCLNHLYPNLEQISRVQCNATQYLHG